MRNVDGRVFKEAQDLDGQEGAKNLGGPGLLGRKAQQSQRQGCLSKISNLRAFKGLNLMAADRNPYH